MKIKKRIESIYSSFDLGLNSILTYSTFVLIKQYLGIDLVGYFGLILSVGAIGETIQQGLYENPLFLNYGVGYKKFRLNLMNISLVLLIPILILDRFVVQGYLLGALLYCITHVLIHNIRIYDYKKNNVKLATQRSVVIFIFQISFFILLLNNQDLIRLNFVLYGISIIRGIFVLINTKKLFAYKELDKNENNLFFLYSAILTLVRSRLPLWLLLPFGLGLVGIYETFRTIMELYLTPSRPIILILLKNLKRDGAINIFYFGLICGVFSSIFVSLTYFQFLKLEIYSINELNSIYPFVALLIITFCYWLSELTGLLFQSNGYTQFDSIRRFVSVISFSIIGLVTYRFLNLNYFLFLISTIYIVEVLISIKYRHRLGLRKII